VNPVNKKNMHDFEMDLYYGNIMYEDLDEEE